MTSRLKYGKRFALFICQIILKDHSLSATQMYMISVHKHAVYMISVHKHAVYMISVHKHAVYMISVHKHAVY